MQHGGPSLFLCREVFKRAKACEQLPPAATAAMTVARVIQLVGIVMAGVASATDYPATWALADHGTVPAATVYAMTDSSNDAQLPGTMSSGDVNGDGINDFAYEFPAGTFNVHFGGISADLDLDSNSYTGSNGFSIVTGQTGHIWGTIAGDVNQDGFNDVLFFHEAGQRARVAESLFKPNSCA